jgi:hypothetical protein
MFKHRATSNATGTSTATESSLPRHNEVDLYWGFSFERRPLSEYITNVFTKGLKRVKKCKTKYTNPSRNQLLIAIQKRTAGELLVFVG